MQDIGSRRLCVSLVVLSSYQNKKAGWELSPNLNIPMTYLQSLT